MAPSAFDLETADGFLAGKAAAARTIDTYLRKAVQSFRETLGYEAEDAISLARVKLYEYLHNKRFRFDCKLSTYVWQIIRNVAIDLVRKQRIRAAVDIAHFEVEDDAPNPEQVLMRQQDVDRGFKVVLAMSEECRKLWSLRLLKGLSHREIAEQLGKTEVNVRQKLFECRRKARELLRKMTDED